MSSPLWSSAVRLFGIVTALGVPALAGCNGVPQGTQTMPLGTSVSMHGTDGSRPRTVRLARPTEAVLYSFKGGSDGKNPQSTLRYTRDALYGTTFFGGTSRRADNNGTVFSVTTSGKEAVLYSFQGGPYGEHPEAGLTNLGYGTTVTGGLYGDGLVYQILPSGEERDVHDFTGAPDGRYPRAELIEANDTLYGTTPEGGTSNNGTVFSVTPSGSENVLYSFNGRGDGGQPRSRLTDVDGMLWGTTERGGYGLGTVFRVTSSGVEAVFHKFTGKPNDGAYPFGGLVNVGGEFYGTTSEGGTSNLGTIFKVTRTGTETVLHNFAGGADGSTPRAGNLILINDVLYGLTQHGGTDDAGTVYSIKPDGSAYSVIHSFGGGADGAFPYAGLIDVGGVLYGTTSGGGASDDGTVFSLTP